MSPLATQTDLPVVAAAQSCQNNFIFNSWIFNFYFGDLVTLKLSFSP